MRKLLVLILVLALTLTMFASCKQEVAQTTTTTTQVATTVDADTALNAMDIAIQDLALDRGDGMKIGIIAFSQGNDWNINAIAGITDYFETYGYTVQLYDTNYDASAALSAAEMFIQNGFDGVVISGGEQTSLEPVAEALNAAGVPFSCIDMQLDGAVISTMADNWGGGTQLGLWVVNKLDGEGKVLILDTPSWVTLLARADSADVVFQNFPGITTTRMDIDAGNAVADAQTQVAAALAADTKNEIKAIVTTWNSPAMGAYAAITDAGRTDIVIASGDTGSDVLMAMRESTAPEWCFMGQAAATLAYRASQGLDLALQGLEDEVPFIMFGPTYFVSNSAEAYGEVLDGSIILHQSPEEHYEEAFGRAYGT